jgi:hypothetical protein
MAPTICVTEAYLASELKKAIDTGCATSLANGALNLDQADQEWSEST